MFNIHNLCINQLAGWPGLSAVEYIAPHLYVIADDKAQLMRCTLDFSNTAHISLFGSSAPQGNPSIAKASKPDLEAMTQISASQLLIMGSGSKDLRHHAILLNINSQQSQTARSSERVAADNAYLAAHPLFCGAHELNIEALANSDSQLYIFQRGNLNQVHGICAVDLAAYLSGAAIENCSPQFFHANPPTINGFASGISGACFVAPNLLLLCASVEATANSYDDGAIIGSFVGLCYLSSEGAIAAEHWVLLTDPQQRPLPVKVEGICLLHQHAANYDILLVTDNDGQPAQSITLTLCLEVLDEKS